MMNDIDFVIMWVDGNDPEWQAEKAKYKVSDTADVSITRYRDWDNLQYWFRGVEKFAPWVRKIHFVTWGHVPSWLDTSNPKINIVNHKDFIPEEYLPTFGANPIELNLHRIKGLAEQFVFLNDDMFLTNNVKPTDFFKNGLPCDTPALNAKCFKLSQVESSLDIYNAGIINEHFDFKKVIKKDWKKWFCIKNGPPIIRTIPLLACPRFPAFWQHHLPSSILKTTMEVVWEKEFNALNQTCMQKFRDYFQVNQWVFKEWQIASGRFVNRSYWFGRPFYPGRDGLKTINVLSKYIENQKCKMICINDAEMTEEQYENSKIIVQKAFDKILNSKSDFEK